MAEVAVRHRIGLFGGTFDPIHVGHLLLAEAARESLKLDEVRFIPAATSPLKLQSGPSDGKQRLEMVRLAIGGNPHFCVDDRELRRGGASFTVDTLAEIRAEQPDAELSFLIGADSLTELSRWKDPAEICRLATVVVLARGGYPPPNLDLLKPFLAEPHRELQRHLIEMPQIEISASNIRRCLAEGRSVRYQLHPAVAAYVNAAGLYREAD